VDRQHLGSDYEEPRILYHNLANGKFDDISATAGPGITTRSSSRGLAIGDFWNDGKLSAVVSNMNTPPSLLVNQVRSSNHWIATQTQGVKSNRDGIGARVRVKTETRIQVDEVRSGSSYDSNSDRRVHFGLGSSARVAWIEIRWPSGLTETFDNPAIDRVVALKEGTGKPTATMDKSK
jgi:hypothetical protein